MVDNLDVVTIVPTWNGSEVYCTPTDHHQVPLQIVLESMIEDGSIYVFKPWVPDDFNTMAKMILLR